MMIKKIASVSLPINQEYSNSLTARLKYSEDVKSIDSIIDAYYNIVSDPNRKALDFERLKFLHLNNTIIIKIGDNNDTYVISLEAEYSAILSELRMNLYKIELNRIVNKYGDFAQVFSTYEIRTDPKVATNAKGRNCMQLHYLNDRWWIAILTIQMETVT